MAAAMRKLEAKERKCRDSLSNLVDLVETYNDERDKDMLEGWKERLEALFSEFEEIRLDLELNEEFQKNLKVKLEESAHDQSTNVTIVEPETVEHANQEARLSFELPYLRIKGFIINKLRDQPRVNVPKPGYQSRVKLPEIKLPLFDGNLKNWPSFRDAFCSLIDSNLQLSHVDKFSYLLSSLSTEVRRMIEGIDVTSDGYSVAWDLLVKRYDNKYLIVKSYVEALFAVEPMKRECHDSLNHLIDEFERNLKLLEKVGECPEDWSTLLVFMLSSRLDSTTLRHWETHRKSSTVVPTYAELIDFLRDHSQVLQSISCAKSRSSETTRSSSQRLFPLTKPNSAHTVVASQKSCPFCKQPSHSPFQCDVFKKMNPTQRYDAVKRNALCLNCLSSEHMVKNCMSRNCQKCNQKHHTMLHKNPTTPSNQPTKPLSSSSPIPPQPPQPKQSAVPQSQTQATAVSAPQTSHFSMPFKEAPPNVPTTVLLSTALVKVFSSSGSYLWARALLDSGSQLNFVSENLSQKLKLPRAKEFVPISGVGLSSTSSKHTTIIRIQSHRADFEDSWKFHVLPKLTLELPSQPVDTSKFVLSSEVVLADPSFSKPGSIDLILGVEVFYDLLKEGQIKFGRGEALLQNTSLGWVVSGKAQPETLKVAVSNLALAQTTTHIDEIVSRFWEIESCHIESTLSVDEAKCEEYFAKTVKRESSGRFVVALPQKPQEISRLGNSRDIADRRFYSLERRFNAAPELKDAYSAFIHEYARMGHMKLIEDSRPSVGPKYYLPHHCIVRPDSVTTKLRVVFDASCASDSGVSLNDALVVGPVVQDDLLAHVLRFRVPRYAIIADIEKMYRQIKVRESDQPLQRIRWRDSPSEPLQTYQLTTVTYGTSSAPYLATKCLQKLSEMGAESHPAAAVPLARNFYMDDLLTGADSIEEGRVLCKELIELTNSACLPLRKWASNDQAVLEDIPSQLKDERTLVHLDAAAAPIKALGLQWDTLMDELRFQMPEYNIELPITKQQVLSDIARLFDPLGLAGPVLVQAKLFLQDLWREGYGWKEPLKETHRRGWVELRDSFCHLADLRIPRCVTSTSNVTSLELHGFSDASERAYGACIYVRAVSITGVVLVKLLASKSKIAPKGRRNGGIVNLPRLELCGALLLAHIFEKVEVSLQLKAKQFFWTDSEIVLHQIAANPSRWKTFVANRCSEIQRITTNGIWSHVPGIDNPADVLSRGMSAEELGEFKLWWYGPKWLSQPSRFWPPLGLPIGRNFTPEELEERTVALSAQVKPPNELFSLYSSYTNLVRTVTLIRRFVHNLRNADRRRVGFILPRENRENIQFLVMLAQRERFAQDLLDVEREQQVKPNSRLKTLSPILHEGLLRVGGRLRHAPVPFDQRHQMILPDRHPLTDLILDHYHEKLKHAGPQLLVAVVRERYWPLRAKSCARQRVHACRDCFRCKPKVMEQIMGELPQERVTPTIPFLHTGVDYCGPFSYRPTRRANAVKCYVAVFICLVTKAVHFECVADLTTKSFIAALKRFISRRGKPYLIESDNALNFQGAKRELEDLANLFRSQQHQEQVIRYCTEDDIKFKFIPPRTPNFGGLWEAAVKSMKNHMRRTVGNVILYLDDFLTILTQIESCLNSRPLTQLSADPNDLEVLTPGHFLVHRSLTAIPEPSLAKIPANRLDRWQQTQEYVRRIWQQWQSEYLSGLQPRTRWTRKRDNIGVGTMVLVKEENLPPLKWRIGRVTEIFKGPDDNIRVVMVRTKDGEYRRGISKICVLPNQPLEEESSNDAEVDESTDNEEEN